MMMARRHSVFIYLIALITYQLPLTVGAARKNLGNISIEDKSNTFTPNSLGVSRIIDLNTHTVAYKDHLVKICYIEKIGSQSVWDNGRTLIIHPKSLTNQQLLTIAGPMVSGYCFGWPSQIVRPMTNTDTRRKRSNQHYFVARKPRGQTQSQYLNYGNSGSAEPGKAEAESTHQGSKAIVYGSSGMGQAQSQSSPFNCADCYGRSGDQNQLLQGGQGFPSYLQTSQQPGSTITHIQRPGGTTGTNVSGPESQYIPGAQVHSPGTSVFQGQPQDHGSTYRPGSPGFSTRPGSSTQISQTPGQQVYGPDGRPLSVDQRYPGSATGLQPGQLLAPGIQTGQQHISDGTGRIGGPGGIQGPSVLRPGQQHISESGGTLQPGQQHISGGIHRPSVLQPGQQPVQQPGQQHISESGGTLQPGQQHITGGIHRPSVLQPGQQHISDGTGRISSPGGGIYQPGYQQIPAGGSGISEPGSLIQSPGVLQPGQQHISDHTGRISGPGGITSVPVQHISSGPGTIQGSYPGQSTPGQQVYDHGGIQRPSGRPSHPSDIDRVPGGTMTGIPGQNTYYIPGGSRQSSGGYPDDDRIGSSPGAYGPQTVGTQSTGTGGQGTQTYPQKPQDGTFSGHLTGQYQSPIGHSGDFSGSFQGKYNTRGEGLNTQYEGSLPGGGRTGPISTQQGGLGGRDQTAPGSGGSNIYYPGSMGEQYPIGTQQQSGSGSVQGPAGQTHQILYPGVGGTTIPSSGHYQPGGTGSIQQPGTISGGHQGGQYPGQIRQYPPGQTSEQQHPGQTNQYIGQTPGTTYPSYPQTPMAPGSSQPGYGHGVGQQPGGVITTHAQLPSREGYGELPGGGHTYDPRLYAGSGGSQGGTGQTMSRDGITYGPDGRIISSGAQHIPGSLQTGQTNGVPYRPDGRLLSTGGQQIGGGSQTGQPGGVTYGPDGRLISTGGQQIGGGLQTGQPGEVTYGPDGRIISTGQHTGQTGGAIYGPDGRLISTGATPGQVPASLQIGQTGEVQYEPDGRILSTGIQQGSPQVPGALHTGQTGADDSDSQAQSTIQRVDNETQASASSSGRFASGSAQSQVSGSYSGQGSFSASAGTNDGLRGAQTQVSGNKDGALSSSQGQGGKGQSQAQVQLAAETGDTSSSAQTSGLNHGTNTQVQSGIKGGMADAQANGPGSTSSQAQIGFTPYDVDAESDDSDPQNPLKGGGTASASSGTHAGKSQVQINGKYAFGIRYTGQAQSSSANSGYTASDINLPTMKPIDFGKHYEKPAKQEKIAVRQIEEAKILKIVTTSTTPEPDEDIPKDSDYDNDYDETEESYPRNLVQQQQTRSLGHDVLDPLEDIEEPKMDVHRGDIQIKHGDIIPTGDYIPGSNGYKIPAGFRGRVSEGANLAETRRIMFAAGAKTNRHRNSGDVGYGAGYTYQPTYAPIQYGFKSTKSYQPKFVSMTKSETGSRNIITGKKTPSVYYTQSSSCGYFTNTCFYSNGKKVCLPKPKANPDGTPIVCKN